MPAKILIIDDEASLRRSLALLLKRRLDLDTLQAQDGAEGLSILASPAARDIKLVILDLSMPGLSGMEVLQQITDSYPNISVVIVTGSTDVNDAVTAMQNGATDFITKPWDIGRILATVQNTLRMKELQSEVSRLRRKENGEQGFSDLIGYQKGLSASVRLGRKAALGDISVLISGDTGVGKEMFARAIHGESHRSGKPFIAVNCGAIPPTLIESTLFGHEKGAFTGAVNRSPGKFREAENGTIFLDEIGELTLDAQTRLLRVLQQKEVEPVGAARAVKVNVRVISATHKNLLKEVRLGHFREDLYFRLNVLEIGIPPLRKRKEDIVDFVAYFLARFSADMQRSYTMADDAMALLTSYEWPGNVRQLENALYRAVTLSEDSRLTADHFSFLHEEESDTGALANNFYTLSLIQNDQFKSMEQLYNEIVDQALEYHDGNFTRAAKALEIPKATFYRRFNKRLHL